MADAESGRLYKLMIMFAVATMYFYRDDIHPIVAGENLGEFAKRNKAVLDRVFEEAMNIHNYELSHEQIGQAVRAYLCHPCTLTTPAYKP